MPWGRVDDTHYDHPKTLALLDDENGLRALGLFWLLISYCNRHLTDGAFSLSSARHICPGPDVPALVAVLKKHNMVDDGPAIHGYLSFNKSRAQVEEERRQWRIRQAQARLSRESHGVSHDGVTGGVTRESHGPVPTPVPVPIPGRPTAGKTNGTTKTTKLPPLDEERISAYEAELANPDLPKWRRDAITEQLSYLGVHR